MIGSIRASQLLALLCFVVGGIALLALRRKYRPQTAAELAYEPLFVTDQPWRRRRPLLSVSLRNTEKIIPADRPDRNVSDRNKPEKEENNHGTEDWTERPYRPPYAHRWPRRSLY